MSTPDSRAHARLGYELAVTLAARLRAHAATSAELADLSAEAEDCAAIAATLADVTESEFLSDLQGQPC